MAKINQSSCFFLPTLMQYYRNYFRICTPMETCAMKISFTCWYQVELGAAMEIAYFYNENWTNFLLFYQKNAILSTTIKCMWHICYTAILEELFRFEQLSNKYTDKKISVQYFHYIKGNKSHTSNYWISELDARNLFFITIVIISKSFKKFQGKR